MPMYYPSGSPVTVQIARSSNDTFLVSDFGFAFRELESFGRERSFARTAEAIIADNEVSRDRRCIFVRDLELDDLSRGIADVASASWQIVDQVYARNKEDDEEEIKDYLTDRLVEIFGIPHVSTDVVLSGASTAPWEMTALVTTDDKRVAFQAVSAHQNSVYRTNAAFDDLAALDDPPLLVAVVHSKASLGPKLTLLARQSFVIEAGQPDADYVRAAA